MGGIRKLGGHSKFWIGGGCLRRNSASLALKSAIISRSACERSSQPARTLNLSRRRLIEFMNVPSTQAIGGGRWSCFFRRNECHGCLFGLLAGLDEHIWLFVGFFDPAAG